MDAGEEAIVVPHAVKRRRTKRKRHFPVTMAPASSSSSEEKDMADCLILLARGPPPEKITSKEVATNGKAEFLFFVCKTCHKRFPTFQALGGHRTSHKKAKHPITPVQEKKTGEIEEDSIQLTMNSFPNSNNGKAARVHECVICGTVFSSGQALGGHMRRHRQTSLPEPVKAKEEAKNEKKNIVMSLDLNLPASDDDYNCSGNGELPRSTSAAAAAPFSFASKPPLLSMSALLDCFY
ncbi:hypothetical protein IEQ34_014024 [Dendrobium chrysotoxum]|uniref:C2H2-type domain-containing protein n=1 Tax=Dendrobium chrysotoxum TaxID=161865 RepID=A0AAV7GIR6_DENCH|nr:hypothetical protein IEQ34_014024 [Dendrobium chrysotoxum]